MALGFYQLCNAAFTVTESRFGTILTLMLLRRGTLWITSLGLFLLSACQAGGVPARWPSVDPQKLQQTTIPPLNDPNIHEALGVGRDAPAVVPSPTASILGGRAAAAITDLYAADLTPPAPSINPLTGLSVPDPTLLGRRPLAIKISNYPRDIRPQYGLNEADVVFEYYIEWGYTRFIGIFYGNDAVQIGPVRSGRYFDEHITRMYHAYYVFNYADPREYTYFLGGDLQGFMVVPGYGSCPPFFQHRVSSLITDVRHYETYFDSTRFADCLARRSGDNSRQNLRPTVFTAAPPSGAATVERILTYYSRCDYNYWQYDAAAARYLRFQEANPSTELRYINDCVEYPKNYSPLIDSGTGEQVSAENVVVIYVSHTFSNPNEQDDEIYHIDLIDSGRAYVFRDGYGLPARWVRTDIDQPLLITTPAGDPLGLRPGRTFFQVIGETSDAWSDGGDWHFDFLTP